MSQLTIHIRSHPERSRSSGGAKDLARSIHGARDPIRLLPASAASLSGQVPRPAGKGAGLRHDIPAKMSALRDPADLSLKRLKTLLRFS